MPASNELRHNVLGTCGAFFFSIAIIAPAFTFTVGSTASIMYSGSVAPLTFLIAGLVSFSIVIPLSIYSRYIVNAGAYYKYVEASIDNRYVSKSMGLWFLLSNPGSIITGGSIIAWFTDGALAELFNVTMPSYYFILISLIVPLLYLIISYGGIRSSARMAIAIGVIQLGVFTALAVAFMIKTSYNSLQYFDISASKNGLHGFFLAMVLGAFYSYGGYGSVVAFGEEIKSPRNTMKRAMIYSLGVMVFLETFYIYSLVAAAGPRINVLGSSIAPTLFLTKIYFGSYILTAILFVSLLGVVFSYVLGGSSNTRYWYALARDGLLPTWVTRVHRRYGSPYVAVALTFVISLVGLLSTEMVMIHYFGTSNGLFFSWAVWGTVGAFFSLSRSIIINTTLPIFIHKIKEKVRLLKHIAAPSVSTIVMLIAVVFSLIGLKSPMTVTYWIIGIFFLSALAVIYLRGNNTKVDKLTDLIK